MKRGSLAVAQSKDLFPLWGYLDPSEKLLPKRADGTRSAPALRAAIPGILSKWSNVHDLFAQIPIPAPGTELKKCAGSYSGVYTQLPYGALSVRLFPFLPKPSAVFNVTVGGHKKELKFATCWPNSVSGPILRELDVKDDFRCSDALDEARWPRLEEERWQHIYLWKYRQ